MTCRTCEAIETLPPLQKPVSVVAVEVFRDGGSTEVTLQDALAQQVVFFFHCTIGVYPSGRLYLKTSTTPACMYPIALNSFAEAEVFRLLQQHLDEHYSADKQIWLAALEAGNVRALSQCDYEGYTLLRCLRQSEELRKLVIMGDVSDPVSFSIRS